MATSGSKDVAATSHDTLRFIWWQSYQIIEDNTTTLGWKMVLISDDYGQILSSAQKSWSVTINGEQFSGTNYISIGNNEEKTLASGFIDILHEPDGEKTFNYSFSQYFGITFNSYVSTVSGADYGNLESIPRSATIIEAPNFSDTDNPTITYDNPAGTASLVEACVADTDNVVLVGYRSIGQLDNRYTFYFTDNERNALRERYTSSDTNVVRFYVRTTIGGRSDWSYIERTFTIAENDNTRPTVSLIVSAGNQGLESQFSGLYIQGKSRANVETGAVGKYGANIIELRTTVEGTTYSGTNIASNVLLNAGEQQIITRAIDSRGFTRSSSYPIVVLPYSAPGILNPICYRCDSYGNVKSDGISIKIEAEKSYSRIISNGVQKNFCQLRWRYKSTSDTWDNQVFHTLLSRDSIENSISIVIEDTSFSITESYMVEISAIDDIGEVTNVYFVIPTDKVVWHTDKGKALGIGRYADLSRPNENVTIAWDVYLEKGIYGTHNYEMVEDVLAFSENCSNGITYFGTDQNSYNLPSASYRGSVGTVKRNGNYINILIENTDDGTIATNTKTGEYWNGWKYHTV